MHAAKVILLMVLTLAVMRVASWSLGWLLKRFSTATRLWIAVMSNGIALAAFGSFLVTQRIPGELIDSSALTFGVVVFSVYGLIDLRWTRWGRTEPSDNSTS
jgi:hypothetical protein